ncbi:MAG: hypothetical protein EBR52_09620, partial [Microbacteriaceae bacterium]|nr:hypothetical protein [Microbacteriaceae bacterium]
MDSTKTRALTDPCAARPDDDVTDVGCVRNAFKVFDNFSHDPSVGHRREDSAHSKCIGERERRHKLGGTVSPAAHSLGNKVAGLLHENRRFPPPPEFATHAVAHSDLYDTAQHDRLTFWADQARRLVAWEKPFTQTLDWSDAPFARWFHDGTLNVSVNCLDRHVAQGHGERVAFYFEGEPGDRRAISYATLTEEVMRMANALTS